MNLLNKQGFEKDDDDDDDEEEEKEKISPLKTSRRQITPQM